MRCGERERTSCEPHSVTTYPRSQWADVSAAGESSERVQGVTPSAQYRARHQSTDEAEKEGPTCASLLPPHNSLCDKSAYRRNRGDREKQSNQMCRSERPHIATSGPSSGRPLADPTTVFAGSAVLTNVVTKASMKR